MSVANSVTNDIQELNDKIRAAYIDLGLPVDMREDLVRQLVENALVLGVQGIAKQEKRLNEFFKLFDRLVFDLAERRFKLNELKGQNPSAIFLSLFATDHEIFKGHYFSITSKVLSGDADVHSDFVKRSKTWRSVGVNLTSAAVRELLGRSITGSKAACRILAFKIICDKTNNFNLMPSDDMPSLKTPRGSRAIDDQTVEHLLEISGGPGNVDTNDKSIAELFESEGISLTSIARALDNPRVRIALAKLLVAKS